jgi:hypothetical protein
VQLLVTPPTTGNGGDELAITGSTLGEARDIGPDDRPWLEPRLNDLLGGARMSCSSTELALVGGAPTSSEATMKGDIRFLALPGGVTQMMRASARPHRRRWWR